MGRSLSRSTSAALVAAVVAVAAGLAGCARTDMYMPLYPRCTGVEPAGEGKLRVIFECDVPHVKDGVAGTGSERTPYAIVEQGIEALPVLVDRDLSGPQEGGVYRIVLDVNDVPADAETITAGVTFFINEWWVLYTADLDRRRGEWRVARQYHFTDTRPTTPIAY